MISQMQLRTQAPKNYLLALLPIKKQLEMRETLQINVKFDSTQSIQLDVDPKWTVKIIKEKLSKKLGVAPNYLKLIFAGKELHNSVNLEEYELSHQSIIHAVKTLRPNLSIEINEEDLKSLKLNFKDCTETNDLADDLKQALFFVYCSNPCKSWQKGKLRVRCNECKQGTLTVSKDPCGWDDVLIPLRIEGTCQVESCNGKFAEFYFKCANHPSTEEETCVALNLIRANVNEVSCLICTEVNNPVLVFTCAKAHVMCIDCFTTYCHTRLKDRQFVQDREFGYTLPCPVGCDNSLIKETHHFRLLGEDEYNRYQRFGAEECLLQAGGVLCPVPGCGAGILPDPDCKKIVCVQQGSVGCGFVFCRFCHQGYHLGECDGSELNASGEQVAFTVNLSQADLACWDPNNKSPIKVLTKPCPQCRTPTERDGGCMHMICTRPQCGFHWCWICQTEWTRDCMGSHWFG